MTDDSWCWWFSCMLFPKRTSYAARHHSAFGSSQRYRLGLGDGHVMRVEGAWSWFQKVGLKISRPTGAWLLVLQWYPRKRINILDEFEVNQRAWFLLQIAQVCIRISQSKPSWNCGFASLPLRIGKVGCNSPKGGLAKAAFTIHIDIIL